METTRSSTKRQDKQYRTLNSLIGLGVCIGNPVCQIIDSKLFAKTRIKSKGHNGDTCYFEICGWEDKAQDINVLCRRGNVVAFEAFLGNVRLNANEVEIIFVAENIEVLRVPSVKGDDDLDRQIKILDIINPEEVLDTDLNLEEMRVKYGKTE